MRLNRSPTVYGVMAKNAGMLVALVLTAVAVGHREEVLKSYRSLLC